MPFLPAVCNFCHAIFPSGIYVRETELHLFGYKVSSCPKCKKNGYVRNGLYKYIGYNLLILKSKRTNMRQLTNLYNVIVLVKRDKLQRDQLEVVLNKELPELMELLLLLPRKKSDYILCLHLLAQMLSAVIKISIEEDQDRERKEQWIQVYQDIRINQILEQIYTNNIGTDRRLF